MTKKEFDLSLFIFNHDLRLDDNIGLINTMKISKMVIPIYIFDSKIFDSKRNKNYNNNYVRFIIESLDSLTKQIKKKNNENKIYYFYGEPISIIKQLIWYFLEKGRPISNISMNQYYTFDENAILQDVLNTCLVEQKVLFTEYEDYIFFPIKSIYDSKRDPYTSFQAFYKKINKMKINKPIKNRHVNFYRGHIDIDSHKRVKDIHIYIYNKNKHNETPTGGREYAMQISQLLNPKTKQSYLSSYIIHGCISIREAYYLFEKYKLKHLIKNLYIRDFHIRVSYFNNRVFFNKAINKTFNKLKFNLNEAKFSKWKEGKTGFPIIDAFMRQLKETGYINNFGRIITASFLIKYLYIDFVYGEQYFSCILCDYDNAINSNNWQDIFGCGYTPMKLTIFLNPMKYGKTYDPKCEFVKKWIPELKDIDNEKIHNWTVEHANVKSEYSKPMINLDEQEKKLNEIYSKFNS